MTEHHADISPLDRRRHRRIRHLVRSRPAGWRRTVIRIKARLGKGPKAPALAKLHRLVAAVDYAISLHLHYLWGGGHASTPAMIKNGCDCSAYGSWLAQGICGVDEDGKPIVWTGTTFTMAGPGRGLERGPGKILTFFIKNNPASDAHVICRITNPLTGKLVGWTESGGRDNTRVGDGPCWFHPTAERIREFPIQVHPKGC